MAWPATNIVNRAAGEFIDDPDWDELVDALNFLANRPACRAYNSANQSVNDSTYQAITFDSERYDTDSMHSTSVNTGRITFNTAGLYIVTLNVGYTAAADYLSARASIRLNGTTEIAEVWAGTQTDANDHYYVAATTSYKFAAADYIEAMVWHNNTANAARNVVATGNKTPEFSAIWIGRG